MASLVEHTMLNGLEENLKSAIEDIGGNIPDGTCIWQYPSVIRGLTLGSGVNIEAGEGISIVKDEDGNYIISTTNSSIRASDIVIDDIQAPDYAKGVDMWPKGTALQSFLESFFGKVLPYVPSIIKGDIIVSDENGDDVWGHDDVNGIAQVKNGLDKNNTYLRIYIASQSEPIYISLKNLGGGSGTPSDSDYMTIKEADEVFNNLFV